MCKFFSFYLELHFVYKNKFKNLIRTGKLKAAESGIPEGSQPDQKLQGAKSDINSPPKLSVSSLDEKAEEHDNIADFLGNVIKYRVIIEKMINRSSGPRPVNLCSDV
jgi:hypothetical protein